LGGEEGVRRNLGGKGEEWRRYREERRGRKNNTPFFKNVADRTAVIGWRKKRLAASKMTPEQAEENKELNRKPPKKEGELFSQRREVLDGRISPFRKRGVTKRNSWRGGISLYLWRLRKNDCEEGGGAVDALGPLVRERGERAKTCKREKA